MNDLLTRAAYAVQIISQVCLCSVPVIVVAFLVLRGLSLQRVYEIGAKASDGPGLLQPGEDLQHYDPASHTPSPTFREEQQARNELIAADVEPTPMRVWDLVNEGRRERTK